MKTQAVPPHPSSPARGRILLAAAFALLASMAVPARAADWYVAPAPFGNDANSGTTDTLPFATIQKGVNTAVPGDSVLLMDGTYTGPGNFNIFYAGKAITVKSINGAAAVIIDCEDIFDRRGFKFQSAESPNSRLEGVTITRGHAPFDPINFARALGGGIFIFNSSPTIVDCVIENCVAPAGTIAMFGPGQGYGGGVYLQNSAATLSDCVIRNCRAVGGSEGLLVGFGGAAAGGGIYIIGGSPTLSGCEISGNIALGGDGVTGGGVATGGGIYIESSTSPAIDDCNIHLNISRGGLPGPALGPGGGVYLYQNVGLVMTDTSVTSNTSERGDLASAGNGGGGGVYVMNNAVTPVINRCLINENVAGIAASQGHGGGIFVENSLLQVTNTTIALNKATQTGAKGGGVLVKSGTATLLNCTVAANQGIGAGGGGVRRDGGAIVAKNTLFVQNSPGGNLSGTAGSIVSNGHNLSSDNSYLLGGTGDLMNNSLHNLQPLANNGGPTLTRAILPPSSAIDAGDDVGAPFIDQRSSNRPEDGNGDTNPVTDIGAYEYIVPTPTPSPSPTPTLSPSPSPSISPTETATPVISFTPSLTPTPTPTVSPTISLTPTPNGALDWEVYG